MSRYIDAEVLDDIVDELNRNGYDISNTTLVRGKIILSHIPTADAVEVVHGEWIPEPNCYYRCSNCGGHLVSIQNKINYSYCPYCGAKMDLKGGEYEQIY